MSALLYDFMSSLENDLGRFKHNGKVIMNIIDFKQRNISDTLQNLYYFRLNDLNKVEDYRITDNDTLYSISSRWVGVFQFEKNDESLKYIQYVLSKFVNFSKCFQNIRYSCDAQKIYLNEAKIADPNAQPRTNYPFHLLYISFDVVEETTFKFKLSEDCENC